MSIFYETIMDENCVRLKIRNKFLKNKKSTSWGYLADFPGGSDDVCIPPKEFLLEPFEQKNFKKYTQVTKYHPVSICMSSFEFQLTYLTSPSRVFYFTTTRGVSSWIRRFLIKTIIYIKNLDRLKIFNCQALSTGFLSGPTLISWRFFLSFLINSSLCINVRVCQR